MPDKNEHLKLGSIVGGGLAISKYLWDQWSKNEQINWFDLLKWAGLGVFGGGCAAMLPDYLEPASNPRHRSVFHSVLSLGVVTSGTYFFCQNTDSSMFAKMLLTISAGGYASHLIADSQTPYGLPFINK